MESGKDVSVVRSPFWLSIGQRLTSRDEYLPLTYFDKVYLIDLCEPLLEVARARSQQKGWKNVVCLCQDASRFVLPEWESGELDPKESLSVITMSYSLSMVSLSTLGSFPILTSRSRHSTNYSTDVIRFWTLSLVSWGWWISTLPEMLVTKNE